ncbi:MAG: hypothetical protein ACI4JA_06835 [Oscillospiraceae bacterium]
MASDSYFIIHGSGFYTCREVVSIYFNKERYSPFTFVSGKFFSDQQLEDAFEVMCYIENKLVHHGLLETVERKFVGGRWLISFRSRSYTLLLAQNEPVPGMNYNVDLTALSEINTAIPNVSFESGTQQVNYIFVKEKSTIWDAICAYGMKAYKLLPYISGTNTVMITPVTKQNRIYTGMKITGGGVKCDRRNMLSQVFMADVDGEYSAASENLTAGSLNIVRRKYYPLDRQWLAEPETGLEMKLIMSSKGHRQSFFTYLGFMGEDLFDRATLVSGILDLQSQVISRIEVNVHGGQVFTTLYLYEDGIVTQE